MSSRDSVLVSFSRCVEGLDDSSINADAFIDEYISLVLTSSLTEREQSELMATKVMSEHMATVQRFVAEREAVLENESALNLIDADQSVEDEGWQESFNTAPALLSLQDYENLVDAELELIGDGLKHWAGSVVFVGAGAIPMTALALHRKTGRSVLAVEHNSESAHLGSAVLHVVAPAGDVQMIHSPGSQISYVGVGLLHLACLAEEKASAASLALSQGVKHILVRSALGRFRLLYEEVGVSTFEALGMKLCGRASSGPNARYETLFFSGLER